MFSTSQDCSKLIQITQRHWPYFSATFSFDRNVITKLTFNTLVQTTLQKYGLVLFSFYVLVNFDYIVVNNFVEINNYNEINQYLIIQTFSLGLHRRPLGLLYNLSCVTAAITNICIGYYWTSRTTRIINIQLNYDLPVEKQQCRVRKVHCLREGWRQKMLSMPAY